MSNIVLIGFMGSGKSTVGKVLGERLGMKVLEMDHDIEREEGRSISDIFAEDGERYFRDLETSYLERALGKSNKVISTGGGIVMRDENRKLLSDIGKVIFLQADIEHIIKNVEGDTDRPLLQEGDLEEKITKMLELREPYYLKVADIIIQASGKTIDNIVDEIIEII